MIQTTNQRYTLLKLELETCTILIACFNSFEKFESHKAGGLAPAARSHAN